MVDEFRVSVTFPPIPDPLRWRIERIDVHADGRVELHCSSNQGHGATATMTRPPANLSWLHASIGVWMDDEPWRDCVVAAGAKEPAPVSSIRPQCDHDHRSAHCTLTPRGAAPRDALDPMWRGIAARCWVCGYEMPAGG